MFKADKVADDNAPRCDKQDPLHSWVEVAASQRDSGERKAAAMLTTTVSIVSVTAIFASQEIFNTRQVMNPTIKPITPDAMSVTSAIDDSRPVVSIRAPTSNKLRLYLRSDSIEHSRTQLHQGSIWLR